MWCFKIEDGKYDRVEPVFRELCKNNSISLTEKDINIINKVRNTMKIIVTGKNDMDEKYCQYCGDIIFTAGFLCMTTGLMLFNMGYTILYDSIVYSPDNFVKYQMEPIDEYTFKITIQEKERNICCVISYK